jgi:hypothetical protein
MPRAVRLPLTHLAGLLASAGLVTGCGTQLPGAAPAAGRPQR